MLEKLSRDIFLDPKGRGSIAFLRFWSHLQIMFNFPEIEPRNVFDCGSRDHGGVLYVIISLDIRVWEGGEL